MYDTSGAFPRHPNKDTKEASVGVGLAVTLDVAAYISDSANRHSWEVVF